MTPTLNQTPWIARVFAGTELDQLSQALQDKEKACAAAEAKLAEVTGRLDQVVAEAERERQISQAMAAGVVTAIDTSYAYIEFDTQGQVLKANGNFCRLLGYSESEIAEATAVLRDRLAVLEAENARLKEAQPAAG